jgi:hypothetical protein
MKNLAGNILCDTEIVNELLAAGIDIVPQERVGGEVATAFHGELNGWGFHRWWSYWIAYPLHPNMGLDIEKARGLYATHGKEARAGGDCATRPPETWSTYFQKSSGKKIILDPSGGEFRSFVQFGLPTDDYVFVSHLIEAGETQRVVQLYHIDTQEGLNAFVEAIR